MKITRIRKLVACGIFKDFSWDKDLPAFGKRNLIYGWNGSGKTTLSSLFHSLQQKTEPEATDVRLELEGNREWRWGVSNNPQLPALRVFNRDFISRSFFEDVGQQLEPVYYVGAESVAQQQELQKLIETKKALETKLELSKKAIAVAEKAVTTFATEHARSIRTLLLGDPAYANYEAPRFKSGIAQLETLDETPRSLSSDEREELNQFRVGRVLPDLDVPKTPKTPLTELSERISKVVKQTVISRKDAPPAHAHSDTQESFFILDGSFEVYTGFDNESAVTVGPGDLISIPKQMMRTFRNTTGKPARILAIIQGPDKMRDFVSFSRRVGADFEKRFGQEVIEHYKQIGMTFDAEERFGL